MLPLAPQDGARFVELAPDPTGSGPRRTLSRRAATVYEALRKAVAFKPLAASPPPWLPNDPHQGSISRPQWNDWFGADSGLLDATIIGALSAQLSRSRSRPAMSASRRLRPCGRDRKLGSHPKGGNSLKSRQEIGTRSDAEGSISIQKGQPFDIKALFSFLPPTGIGQSGV